MNEQESIKSFLNTIQINKAIRANRLKRRIYVACQLYECFEIYWQKRLIYLYSIDCGPILKQTWQTCLLEMFNFAMDKINNWNDELQK